MVIEPKKTYIAYRCPNCGKGVISSIGIFSVNADMLKLKCECGGSEMTVVGCREGQVRLSVPCIMCPKPHNYTVSKKIFFGRDIFILQCPYSNLDLCFMGEEEKVSAELDRTERELLEMIGEDNLSQLSADDAEEILCDPQLYDMIMFVLRELAEEDKIECKCKRGEADIGVDVLDDDIRVVCRKCGAERIIPIDSDMGVHAFLDGDKLILTDPE